MKELEEIEKSLLKSAEILIIRSLSIDEVNNEIDVYTELNSEIFGNMLDRNVDRNAIEVKKSNHNLEEQANYTLNGERIEIGLGLFTSNSPCTIGFAAKDSSGNPGVVTAGHCLEGHPYDKNVYYYNGSTIGDTRNYRNNQGDIDAGFVELRDPWIGTTWLPSRDLVHGGSYELIATYNGNYAVGTNVEFHGTYGLNMERTTIVDYGQITKSSTIWTSSTGELLKSDLVQTNIVTHGGDSGGPLISLQYAGSGYYARTVIGVLAGGDSSSYSNYSKTGNILNLLNLTPY